MSSLFNALLSIARDDPGRLALIRGRQSIDYRRFVLAIEERRRWFAARQIAAGDQVILFIQDPLHSLLALLALRAVGARTIAVSHPDQVGALRLHAFRHCVTLAAERERLAAAQALSAGGILVHPLPAVIDAPTRQLPEFLAHGAGGGHVLYTSGTTGTYKKLWMDGEQDHRVSVLRARHFGYDRNTVFGASNLGLWTAIGYKQPLAVWAAGGCVLLAAGERQWESFHRHKVTDAYAVPAGVRELLAQAAGSALPKLDFQLCVGAGFVAEETTSAVLARLTDKLTYTYGSTEISLPPLQCAVASADDIYWYTPTARDGVEIVDANGVACAAGQEGTLRVRLSDLDYADYLGDAETSARVFRDGCFYPGDMAIARPDGRVRLTGRVADVLVYNGAKYATAPWEQALRRLFQVGEVCLFSGVNKEGEEEVVVVLETARSDLDFAAAFSVLPQRLFPKLRFCCIRNLPRNDTGTMKVKRDVLKRMLFAIKP